MNLNLYGCITIGTGIAGPTIGIPPITVLTRECEVPGVRRLVSIASMAKIIGKIAIMIRICLLSCGYR
jgi:hypothetical protein